MHTIQFLLARPEVERLGWVLLHFVWQGAVIAALCAVAFMALRRVSQAGGRRGGAPVGSASGSPESANLRYLIACGAPADNGGLFAGHVVVRRALRRCRTRRLSRDLGECYCLRGCDWPRECHWQAQSASGVVRGIASWFCVAGAGPKGSPGSGNTSDQQ